MSDYTAKNIAHFNKRAASYESPMKLELSRRICEEAFLKAPGVKWDPDSTVVVDFACGTGIASFLSVPNARFDFFQFIVPCKEGNWFGYE